MKILYIHQYFALPTNSGGTRSYDLAKEFVDNGYEVEIITTSKNMSVELKEKWGFMETDKIKIHILKLHYDNSMTTIQRIIVFWKFLWHVSFKILKLNGDLVIATSTPLTIGIPALIKKWIHKTPFIFEVRDVWPEAVIAIGAIRNKFFHKILFWLESLIYKNADAIIPLSVDMKKSITSRYKSLSCPITVIENISELNRFQTGYDPKISILQTSIGFKPRFAILYAGSFGKVNGISYVIQLATKLLPIDPTIVFVLIGFGAEKDNIIKLAKNNNVLNKNVFILNPISKNELPQFYYEIQMGSSFVIPIKELWANSANKFFDTLAAGRPMLINHDGWQKEILTQNNAGFILPHDLKVIDENILMDFVQYTKDQNLQERQQENALKLAQNFSLEQASSKYITVFNSILK